MDQQSSIFKASHGVMTEEVGVISGELELKTSCHDDGTLELAVTYVGAAEWYTLPGKDYKLHDVRDHAVVHQLLVNVLERA
ncbi:MAG: hypothetical protein LPJ96_11050 [Exiguobacterium sp.]|uniref:Uncharacterized protein n=1 Tax=Exiguobacterium alkaliphilum TaxID=1428684 RepID=A0ABT2KYB3_9BACL|nr:MULTISPECIES: hypothetical protein [Exiguobacterium]MDX5324141.1 hypothetical protein [Exiguobacterium sp.]MCT4795024.1 hypothetical protein [Exiguobacterium alkaliphilum]MDX5425966.1 hypothetical protein [Exiguobacterium sp.]MDX6773360.1 hypothetical protein [Exiguobacterium sp.]QUE86648.1 hypothetical protein KB235_01515 [Exiguobacterium alkaliphilum]